MNSSIFFIIFISVVIGIEVYAFFGIKSLWKNKKSSLNFSFKIFYWILLTAGILSMILIFSFREHISKLTYNIVIGVFIVNLISKLVLLLFVLIDDILRLFRLIAKLFRKKTAPKQNISRLKFLQKSGVIAASIPLSSLSGGVVFGGAYRYKVRSENLFFENLPKAFDGLKIVQISDIHSGSFYNKEAVKKGVQMILDQKPDIVFFTGDIVNERADEMDDYYDVFDKIKAPLGVYSILGNHDYGDYYPWKTNQERLENFESVKNIHQKLGWKLMLDEHVYLEKENNKIAIIGIENWGSGFHQFGDMEKASRACEAPFKILLSHDPTHWEDQVLKDYQDIDLTLSGHTHGAQMGIETHGFKWSPIQLRYSRWAGLYQENNQKLYINRGFGFIGYPGRIGIWPEITVINLKHKTIA